MMPTLKEVQAAAARAVTERAAEKEARKLAVLNIVDDAAGVAADAGLRAKRLQIRANAHEFLPSGILCDCGTQLVHLGSSGISGNGTFHECVACGLSVKLGAFPSGDSNGKQRGDW